MHPDLLAFCSHLPPANFHNPLRLDDEWLTETVVAMSRGIATENAFDRLPILADALEEAGCNNATMLQHLRLCEHHRVECWALRRILRTTLVLPGGMEMPFMYCPPGLFQMGSPKSEEERSKDEQQHEVHVTRGFYAGMNPVTQAEWASVIDTDPSRFEGATLPVENVSWDAAQAFCAKLRDLTGMPVRLPTEAEWEYACRGDSTTPFYWGHELNGKQANCSGDHPYGTGNRGPNRRATSPVGSYAVQFPHPWGLNDFHGNVFEWCSDWYDADFYDRSPVVDPECWDGVKQSRVMRGGCWFYEGFCCRAAKRSYGHTTDYYGLCGFRVVFNLD
jgi:formylglycine-generating enzyme required for sulfatase activity